MIKSSSEKKHIICISISKGIVLMSLLILIMSVFLFEGNAYADTHGTEEETVETASEASEKETTEEIPKPDEDAVKTVTQYINSAGLNVNDNYLRLIMNRPDYGYLSGNIVKKEEDDSLPPSRRSKYKDKAYVIDDYDIYVKVNENNTLEITERLNVWFNRSKHGIFRTLPIENDIVRPDGTTVKIHTRISDIDASEKYTTSYKNNELKIQMGDSDEKVKGQKEYTISYTYNLGKDQVSGADELYYNLIGTGWDTVIGHVSFTIDMPESFDSDKIGFAAGWRGSADNTDVKYTVNGSRITGEYDRVLLSGQGVTIRIELPEGYFEGARLGNIIFDLVMYALPVVFLIISFLLWKRYGKDDVVVETVEFYPPDGMNSLQTAFLYKGTVEARDVSSLLIYLADKGYLEIEESEEKVAFWRKKSFRIIKKRDYDGTNPEEEKFFKGLFCESEEINGETAVTGGQLYDRFYSTTDRIICDVKSKDNMDKVFEEGSFRKSVIIGFFAVISVFAIFIPPVLAYSRPYVLAALILPVLCYGITLAYLFRDKGRGPAKVRIRRSVRYFPGRLAVYLFLMTGVIPLFAVFPPVLRENVYVIGVITGICCIVGMIIFIIYMPKRTPYGIRMLGRIEGFRNFLVTAEKDDLEEMVMADPEYFFHILPYTYVLGVSDLWISKFEEIQLRDPGWCRMPYVDVRAFGTFTDHAMATADHIFTAGASRGISSGGGFSGGGFSGGGFSGSGAGGGGGGAW